jgi:23S rRNA pseudouridine1911/1915/1917 synthase
MAETTLKKIVKINQETTGNRIDIFLSQNLTEISRSKIQKGIDDGLVLINNVVPKKRQILKTGDIVEIANKLFNDRPPLEVCAEDLPIDILFEDENYVAVNKQAGMVVHPGNGNPNGTLVNALLFHINSLSSGSSKDRPGIVHRLDKNTSGVIVVAKNDRAHGLLTNLFVNREIEKEYTGICIGAHPLEKDRINLPIGRKKNDPVRWCVRKIGKESVTDYCLLSYKCGLSLIQFRPLTGRTHQIRVHSSHLGFPIIQDNLYGGDRNRITFLEPMDRVFAYKVYSLFNRQGLHARSISFVHPFSKLTVTIEAPYPKDFCRAISLFD